MAIELACLAASGPGIRDCHIITSRFDLKSKEETAREFLIVQSENGTLFGRRRGNYRDLWRSPDGTLYAVLEDCVSWCPDAATGKNDWHDEPTQGLVNRIDGVGRELVFAYGYGETVPLHRLDAGRWVHEPAPGWLLRIHGPDPSLVYGVGRQGLIARWDRSGWTIVPTNMAGSFKDLFVASADEMYAVHEGGLWEGSVHGWALRLPMAKNDLLSVCVWKGRTWVGSRTLGLCTLDGMTLTTVKDNQAPEFMDARGELLLLQHDKVVGTADGEKYGGFRLHKFADMWDQGPPPHWL